MRATNHVFVKQRRFGIKHTALLLFLSLFELFAICKAGGNRTLTINGITYKTNFQTLGSRGACTIYKAYSVNKGWLAIKRIQYAKRINPHEEWREHFLQELRVSRHFRKIHPYPTHIIHMYNEAEDKQNKIAWLVMERGTLDLETVWFHRGLKAKYVKMLARNKFYSASRLVTGIVHQTIKALVDVQKSFIHRDFKGDNFVFVRNAHNDVSNLPPYLAQLGTLKLIDFTGTLPIRRNRGGHECVQHRRGGAGRASSVGPEAFYRCDSHSKPYEGTRKITSKLDMWSMGVFIRNLIFPTVTSWKFDGHCGTYYKTINAMGHEADKLESIYSRKDELSERRAIISHMWPLAALKCATEIYKIRPTQAIMQMFGLKLSKLNERSLYNNFFRLITIMKACLQLDPSVRPTATQIAAFLTNKTRLQKLEPPPKRLARLIAKNGLEIAQTSMLSATKRDPQYFRKVRELIILPLSIKYEKVLAKSTGVCTRPDVLGCRGV